LSFTFGLGFSKAFDVEPANQRFLLQIKVYISYLINTNFKYLRMKKVMFLFMLLFSMSIFASGFETSDLETKEKTEMIQDISFDLVSIVEDFQLISNVDTPHQSNLKVLCLKTFKERNKDRAEENKINSFYLQAYRINGYVGWNC
jgi:hypothetical protein